MPIRVGRYQTTNPIEVCLAEMTALDEVGLFHPPDSNKKGEMSPAKKNDRDDQGMVR